MQATSDELLMAEVIDILQEAGVNLDSLRRNIVTHAQPVPPLNVSNPMEPVAQHKVDPSNYLPQLSSSVV